MRDSAGPKASSGEAAPPEATPPAVCRYTRFGKEYTCTLPHCKGCGSHFDPGRHTQAVLCQVCIEWAQIQRRSGGAFADILEMARERLAIRAGRAP